jgi:hypothetical protein
MPSSSVGLDGKPWSLRPGRESGESDDLLCRQLPGPVSPQVHLEAVLRAPNSPTGSGLRFLWLAPLR